MTHAGAGDRTARLREAHQAVEDARARGSTALGAVLLDKLRQRYDEAAAFGIIHNRLRDWHEGNHPGYALGCWLRDYKEQVFLFTRDFAVTWTNDLASHCTSWVCSAVSGLSRWSGRVAGVVFSVACGTDSFRQRAAEVGVVAAS